MADLRIGNYHVRPDTYGWAVDTYGENQKGQEVVKSTTYPGSLESALRSVMDQRIKEAPGSGCEAILAAVRQFRVDIAPLFVMRIEE